MEFGPTDPLALERSESDLTDLGSFDLVDLCEGDDSRTFRSAGINGGREVAPNYAGAPKVITATHEDPPEDIGPMLEYAHKIDILDLLKDAPEVVINGASEIMANMKKIDAAEKTEQLRIVVTDKQLIAAKYLLARLNGDTSPQMLVRIDDDYPEMLHVSEPGANGSLAVTEDIIVNGDHMTMVTHHNPDIDMPYRPKRFSEITGSHDTLNLNSVRGVRIYGSLEDLKAGITASIQQQLNTGGPKTKTVTGPSGAGKSTFVRLLESICREFDTDLRVIECDSSIATKRGPLRIAKDRLPGRLPFELYTDRTQTILSWMYTILSGKKGIEIEIPRMYKRAKEGADIGKGEVSFKPVPENRGVISLAEGSDAAHMATEVSQILELFGKPHIDPNPWLIMPTDNPTDWSSVFNAALGNALARGRGKVSDENNPWKDQDGMGEYATMQYRMIRGLFDRMAASGSGNIVLPVSYRSFNS